MPTPAEKRRQQVKAALAKKRATNPKVPLVRQQPAIPVTAPVNQQRNLATGGRPNILNKVEALPTRGAEKSVKRSLATVPVPTTEGVQQVEQAPAEFGSTSATDPVPTAVPERNIGQVITGAPRASARASAQAGQAVEPVPLSPLAVQAPTPVTTPAPEPVPAPIVPEITPPAPARPDLAGTPSAPALAEAEDSYENLFQKQEAETLQRLRAESAGKATNIEAEYNTTLETFQDQAEKQRAEIDIRADKEEQKRKDRAAADGQLPTDAAGNLTRSALDVIAAIEADVADRVATEKRTIDSKLLSDKLALDVKKQDDLGQSREDINKFELESLGRRRDSALSRAESEQQNEQAIVMQQLKGAQDLQSMAFQGQIDLTTQEQRTLQEGAQAMQLQAQGALLDTQQKLAIQEANAITDERLKLIQGEQNAQARYETAGYQRQNTILKAQIEQATADAGITNDEIFQAFKDVASIDDPNLAQNALQVLSSQLRDIGIEADVNSFAESILSKEQKAQLETEYQQARIGSTKRANRKSSGGGGTPTSLAVLYETSGRNPDGSIKQPAPGGGGGNFFDGVLNRFNQSDTPVQNFSDNTIGVDDQSIIDMIENDPNIF